MGLLALQLADVLPWILYPWLVVSLCVYAYRTTRRFDRRKKEKAEGTRSDSKRSGEPTSVWRTDATAPEASTESRAPKNEGSGPVPEPSTPIVRPRSLVEQAIIEEVAKREAGGSTDDRETKEEPEGDQGTRAGLFAPASPPPAAPSAAPSAAPTVADVLAGISLPCDLTPLVIDPTKEDPYRVRFVTTGFTAADIGAQLGDELERLGFSLSSENNVTVLATRDRIQVRAIIYPDGRATVIDGTTPFAAAPGGSIVVEFAT